MDASTFILIPPHVQSIGRHPDLPPHPGRATAGGSFGAKTQVTCEARWLLLWLARAASKWRVRRLGHRRSIAPLAAHVQHEPEMPFLRGRGAAVVCGSKQVCMQQHKNNPERVVCSRPPRPPSREGTKNGRTGGRQFGRPGRQASGPHLSSSPTPRLRVWA